MYVCGREIGTVGQKERAREGEREGERGRDKDQNEILTYLKLVLKVRSLQTAETKQDLSSFPPSHRCLTTDGMVEMKSGLAL